MSRVSLKTVKRDLGIRIIAPLRCMQTVERAVDYDVKI